MFYSFYKDNYKKILNVLFAALSFFLLIVSFKYFYNIATPIFFGLIIFSILEPFASFLHKKGLKKWIATGISTISIFLFCVGFSILFSALILNFVQDFSKSIPAYASSFESFVIDQSDTVIKELDALPEDVVEKVKNETAEIIKKASVVVSTIIGSFANALSSSVKLVANIAIGFIFAVMLSIDIASWKKFILSYSPQPVINSFIFLRENVVKGINGYVTAQLKLIGITFIVVFIALMFLKVENALTIAFLAGVFDVLPLLGVSTLFIPWIIYLFITGNTFLAASLSILLLVVLGTRQLLEPKITGDSLGVNASVMLFALIISTSLLGLPGLLLSPIIIILIKELIVQGYFNKWFGIKPK